ncbi:MAG: ethanolamine ammonia-lyase subunit EutB [Clostridiales bacterium]|nr:ethanolamine ammonia-lyase subunit EutB [Clostridiales bacterium]
MDKLRTLLSVGIDIGTTTTQILFTRLTMETSGGYGCVPKTEITGKEIVYRSPIYFTPLKDDRIDGEGTAEIIRTEYAAAGFSPHDIDTGAVIMSRGLSSETIAAAAKLMGNLDLIYAANKIHPTAHCCTTIGRKGIFSSRVQPNHPTDSVKGVTASLLEGLSYASGDAVLGLNPAIDTVESTTAILRLLNDVKERYGIPTQICVLSHISTQIKAARSGAPMNLCFQSIAGSEKALNSFGTSAEMLAEGLAVMEEYSLAQGPDYMYFETGQASELSSDANFGTDQQTMESRCYGLARHYHPFLVNTVVGFMGPEYLYDGKQIMRAALEDVFCGKMHGLPMGCDCCYTNHAQADQNDIDSLITVIGAAGCCYVMGVPSADDVMLMYQSTGFHDIQAVREILGLRPIPEFEAWAEKLGILENGKLGRNAGDLTIFE